MTAPPPAGAARAAAPEAPDLSTTWDRLRRWRPTRRTAALAVLLLVALAVLSVARPGRTGYLDPRAVDPQGSRALATLLVDQGVTVHDETTLAGTLRAAPGAGVLLTDALLPTPDMVDEVLAAQPARIILVGAGPGMPAFDRLAAGVEPSEAAGDGPLEPRCALPAPGALPLVLWPANMASRGACSGISWQAGPTRRPRPMGKGRHDEHPHGQASCPPAWSCPPATP